MRKPSTVADCGRLSRFSRIDAFVLTQNRWFLASLASRFLISQLRSVSGRTPLDCAASLIGFEMENISRHNSSVNSWLTVVLMRSFVGISFRRPVILGGLTIPNR